MSALNNRDRRLDEILADYLQAVDRGEPPDPQPWVARHPDLAPDLRQLFAEHDRMQHLAGPLRPVARAARLGPAGAGEAPTAALGEEPGPVTVPSTFGDYEVLEKVGAGGMGVVYRARQKSLDRMVALKFGPASVQGSAADVDRFRDEAAIVAHLDHPHIVPIYEVGRHNDRPFFSMKLLTGGSLAELVAGPDWHAGSKESVRRAARLLVAVAGAVHKAHEAGILHRDLKPGNILLGDDGWPFVTDFGLAKRLPAVDAIPTAERTEPGALVGTVRYMAPEQTRTDVRNVTRRTDVYGLGVVLYFLLTGRAPFEGGDLVGTIDRIRHDLPVAPGRVNPAVDRDLEVICLKCLEKEPSQRYASAADLADDLTRWLTGEPIHARPPNVWRRTARLLRRRRWMAAAAALLLLAALGAAGSAWWVRQSHHREWAAFQNVRASLRQALSTLDADRLNQARTDPDYSRALRTDLAEKAPLYEKMIAAYPDDTELRTELAAVYRRRAWLETVHGDRQLAFELTEKARDLLVELTSAHPELFSARSDLADTYRDLSLLHTLGHRPGPAREDCGRAIKQRERLLTGGAEDPEAIGDLAMDWLALAALRQTQGDRAGAEEAFVESERVLRRLRAIPSPGSHLDIATYFIERGVALVAMDRDTEADEALTTALVRLDAITPLSTIEVSGKTRPLEERAAALRALAASPPRTLASFLGSLTPEERFRSAIAFYTRKVKDQTHEPSYRRRLARLFFYASMFTFAVRQAGGADRALDLARQGRAAYADLRKAAGPNADDTLKEAQLCATTANWSFVVAGRYADGEAWCAQALAVLDGAAPDLLPKPEVRVLRRDTLLVRATYVARQERYLDALDDFSAAFVLDPGARVGPFGDYYAACVAAARKRLIVTLLRQERLADARTEADHLARLPGIPGEALYDAASVYGVATGKAADAAAREKYAARCVDLLRRAFAAGFGKDPIQSSTGLGNNPVQWMENDRDLTAVRGRQDYRRLVEELTKKR